MSFESDMKAFAQKIERVHRDVFVGSTLEVQRSVVEGSEITGAPGQPEDTGLLKGSFIPEYTGPDTWQTATNVEYAPHVEDDVQNANYTTGGPHSVKMTRSGWQRIVDAVHDRVVGQ